MGGAARLAIRNLCPTRPSAHLTLSPFCCSNWLDEEEGDEEAATRPATKVSVWLLMSTQGGAGVTG